MHGPLDVRKLRVHTRAGDSLAWRRRAEAELRDVEVPSLRGSPAIFCVRSMRLDGSGAADRAHSSGLGTALGGALERLFHKAARPARGFVPAGAEAVIFADRAELLACLARDWLRGETRSRWWWAALLARESAVEAVTRAWQSSPEHVPAALAQLAGTNDQDAFLRRLPAASIGRLAARVARTFALEDLKDAVQNAVELALARDALGAEARASESARTTGGDDLPLPAPAPWSDWVKCETGLPAASQTLLVLSAMHFRAPALARSFYFLNRVRNFAASVRSLFVEQVQEAATAAAGLMASTIPATTRGKIIAEASPVTAQRDPDVRDVSISRSAPRGEEAALVQPVDSSPAAAALPRLREKSTHVPTPSASRSDAGEGWECSTAWGGVFYLVNAALALELYGDFTRPRHASLGLPVWDFLALMGRQIIGAPLVADKCWGGLARLAGRPANEEPGVWFEPPGEWRVPDSWLGPFPERTGWTGGIRAGRVQLRHPAGFMVLDAACGDAEAAARLHTECARFGLRPGDVGPLDRIFHTQPETATERSRRREEADHCELSSNPPPHVGGYTVREKSGTDWFEGGEMPVGCMNWWLDLLASYLDARWCRALGENQPEAARQIVFQHDARVCVAGGQVTIRFSLATHPLALRLAGLDRDPGWVPAAGMSIAFEYG